MSRALAWPAAFPPATGAGGVVRSEAADGGERRRRSVPRLRCQLPARAAPVSSPRARPAEQITRMSALAPARASEERPLRREARAMSDARKGRENFALTRNGAVA